MASCGESITGNKHTRVPCTKIIFPARALFRSNVKGALSRPSSMPLILWLGAMLEMRVA